MGSIDRLAWMLVLLLPALAGLLACRRRLPLGPRVALEYCMGLYVLIYFLGATRLYLWQEAVVDDYYAGHGPLPIDLSWDDVLLVAALPLLIVPWFVLLLQETTGTLWRSFPQGGRIGGVALGMGAGLGFGAGIALVAPQIPDLLNSAWNELLATEGLKDLYARRREVFSGMRAMHAGLIYGTLPACAALLMFERGRERFALRTAGLCMAAIAVVLMLGTFQIGPVMSFVLMLAFCFHAFTARRLRWLPVLLIVVSGLGVLKLYSSLKEDGKTRQDSLLTFVMRMPIALPFALEMKQEAPQLVESTDSMPHELAEFMDAEFRRGERFASMALPGFVIGWMTDGAAGAIFSLALIALLVFAGGNALECAGISTRPGRGVALLSVMLGPALYYAFQIDLASVFVSSYGVLYLAIPVLLTIACHVTLATIAPPTPNALEEAT